MTVNIHYSLFTNQVLGRPCVHFHWYEAPELVGARENRERCDSQRGLYRPCFLPGELPEQLGNVTTMLHFKESLLLDVIVMLILPLLVSKPYLTRQLIFTSWSFRFYHLQIWFSLDQFQPFIHSMIHVIVYILNRCITYWAFLIGEL